MTSPRHILVRGTKTGLPYSKGLLATSVLATGVSPATAYEVAERVEAELRTGGASEVTVDELRDVAAKVLHAYVGPEASDRYLQWQHEQSRDRPLIMLIGGATGVGKSTVATQVAARLGITRIVSTDAVREVMRSVISAELLPSLHVSSFEAVEAVPQTWTGDDPVLGSFLRQASLVSVGLNHVLGRAVLERSDLIVEGVHVVPGAIRIPDPSEAIVVQLVLTVEDPDAHRSHLSGRSQDTLHRPSKRYLEHFTEIRRIHDDLVGRARADGVPAVRSFALDATVVEVTALVVDAISRHQGDLG